MTEIINFFLNITEGMGYLGVYLLMTIESSFIPFPSEIVVPPASYLASKGVMNLYLIILVALAGSLSGAIINYMLAFHLGRKMIYSLSKMKFSRYLMISEENLHKSENLIRKYGSVSTFFGRLIPAVRQLISIPAGFSKMNFFSFAFFTALGSFIWVTILALLGYFLGENQEILNNYFTEIKWAIILLAILGVLIFLSRRFLFKRS